jgi:hypothetical protein
MPENKKKKLNDLQTPCRDTWWITSVKTPTIEGNAFTIALPIIQKIAVGGELLE